MVHQLELFENTLPVKPYCSDDLEVGLQIRNIAHAIKHRYIQPNSPWRTEWIVYDVDRAGSYYDWYDRDCPAPNIVATNRKNGHSHLFYNLEVPVLTKNPNAKLGPYRYLSAVDIGLTDKLSADPGYVKLIAKNPLRRDAWEVGIFANTAYELGELADWVRLPSYSHFDKRQRPDNVAYGRNCNLFEQVRHWAYSRRQREQGWFGYDYFFAAVLDYAQQVNIMHNPTNPLPMVEVKATAKSIARWTWENITLSLKEYSERTRRKGLEVRAKQSLQRARIAMALKAVGYKQVEIAEWLSISDRWVRKLLKTGTLQIRY